MVEGGPAGRIAAVGRSTEVQQGCHDGCVPGCSGMLQRRGAVGVGGIRWHALPQQLAHERHVPAGGRVGQDILWRRRRSRCHASGGGQEQHQKGRDLVGAETQGRSM